MDAIETSLKQPQGPGAAAFLQGFAAAVMAGDVAFELLLLLLKANAGALLQRKARPAPAPRLFRDQLQQLLLSNLQLLELLAALPLPCCSR